MSKIKVKQIRRSQTLTPFGVGSILDVDGESFVATDISWWDDKPQKDEIIHEDRLSRLLGVSFFRSAPAAPDRQWEEKQESRGVPFRRFPHWLFCPKCRRMERYYWQETPYCQYCKEHPKLVPMRFVMACPRGHMSDVPWFQWAHSESKSKCEDPVLRFVTRPGGSGLEFLSVECLTCGAKRTLKGIASRDSLGKLGVRCGAKNPWEPKSEGHKCDAIPQVLQRGATNLTFAKIESAITIPNTSHKTDHAKDIIAHPLFNVVKNEYSVNNSTLIAAIIAVIAKELGVTSETVHDTIQHELNSQTSENSGTTTFETPTSAQRLLLEEYDALLAPDKGYHQKETFVKRFVDLSRYPSSDVAPEYRKGVELLKNCIDQIVQINRLREVRALVGFSRLSPADTQEEATQETGKFSTYGNKNHKIAPTLLPIDFRDKVSFHQKWLPAIEVFGEGIFVTLNEERLGKWEKNRSIIERVAPLIAKKDNNATYLPEPTPRLLLLHTMAHLMIRQLSFECGYAISSLRERIYCSLPNTEKTMAGILIYTAAGDAEGTLGGLVRQGEPDRLISTLMKCIQNAEWCSSDPLCRESTGQGPGALNLAACHSCSLLPETSCVMSNKLLDRGMLFGSMNDSNDGYFSEVITHILATMR